MENSPDFQHIFFLYLGRQILGFSNFPLGYTSILICMQKFKSPGLIVVP